MKLVAERRTQGVEIEIPRFVVVLPVGVEVKGITEPYFFQLLYTQYYITSPAVGKRFHATFYNVFFKGRNYYISFSVAVVYKDAIVGVIIITFDFKIPSFVAERNHKLHDIAVVKGVVVIKMSGIKIVFLALEPKTENAAVFFGIE